MEAIHNHTPKFFWNGLRSLTFGCLILFTCWLYCIRNFKVQWGGNATNYEDCGNKFFEWFHLQIMTVRFEKCMTRKRRNQPWNLLGLLYRLCMNCFHSCVIGLQSTNCFFFFPPQSKGYVARAQNSFDLVKTHIKMGFIWIETSFDVLQ